MMFNCFIGTTYTTDIYSPQCPRDASKQSLTVSQLRSTVLFCYYENPKLDKLKSMKDLYRL